jgi:hypothetical protein
MPGLLPSFFPGACFGAAPDAQQTPLQSLLACAVALGVQLAHCSQLLGLSSCFANVTILFWALPLISGRGLVEFKLDAGF